MLHRHIYMLKHIQYICWLLSLTNLRYKFELDTIQCHILDIFSHLGNPIRISLLWITVIVNCTVSSKLNPFHLIRAVNLTPRFYPLCHRAAYKVPITTGMQHGVYWHDGRYTPKPARTQFMYPDSLEMWT